MKKILTACLFTILLLGCEKPASTDTAEVQADTDEKTAPLILVSGVTGRQGGAVATALLENNFRVRGLTRNPSSERAMRMQSLGIEMVKADFNDRQSLDMAMQGVYGVYSVQNFWEHGYEAEVQQGKNFADAALQAGVKHFVFSSVASADDETGIPHFDSKYAIEKYIQSLKLPYTIFRPVSFMENWEYSRESIIAGKLHSPFSLDTRLQQISVRDIGRFVALAFSQPEDWLWVSFDIAAEEYTLAQVVKLFSQITGSPVEYIQTPWEEFERDAGEEMTIMDRWIDSVGYTVNINLARSKLNNMRTLEQYLIDSDW